MWRNLFSNLALVFATLVALEAQTPATIDVSASANRVLVSRTLPLQADAYTEAGATIAGIAYRWVSSAPSVAAVSDSGEVRGLLPGLADITAIDPASGLSGHMIVRVLPLRLELNPPDLEIRIGSSAKLTARALDADSKPIDGVSFRFSSDVPGIAAVSPDGTVTPASEGSVSVLAELDGAAANLGFVASAQIRVLRRADYRVTRLFATNTNTPSNIVSLTALSGGAGDTYGAIASLSNGSQAAVLFESGKPRVLAASGQQLDGSGRLIMRLNAISVNLRGDAAVLAEFPDQFCSFGILLFRRGQPDQEVATNCTLQFTPRSLADDGSLLYRINDSRGAAIIQRSSAGEYRTVLTTAGQPSTPDGIRSINFIYPSRAGTALFDVTFNSGTRSLQFFDGRQLKKAYNFGDAVDGKLLTGVDEPQAGPDGVFYSRASGNGFTTLLRLGAAPPSLLAVSGTSSNGVGLNWFHTIHDARDGKILVSCDLQIDNKAATHLAVFNGTAPTSLTPLPAWNSTVSAALLPGGAVVANLLTNPSDGFQLRSFQNGSAATVLAGGAPLPVNIPSAVDWRYLTRGAAGPTALLRGAGDSLVRAGTSGLVPLVTTGTPLPGGDLAIWIGGMWANRGGDVLFTSGYRGGSGLYLLRNGKIERLVDTTGSVKGPGNRNLSYIDSYRGRYLAVNNRGDAATVAYFGGPPQLVTLSPGDTTVKLIATVNTPGPGGILQDITQVAIDDLGRVAFTSRLDNGRRALFYWDGSSLNRLATFGDSLGNSFTINEFSSVVAAGKNIVVMFAFGNYSQREIRSFDGQKWTTLVSTDWSLLGGASPSYFWSNEVSAGANGDTHFFSYTQDGAVGVYAHHSAGADQVVARSSERLPGGEYLLMPLSVSSSDSGDLFFTAYVTLDGKEMLALYQASPQ